VHLSTGLHDRERDREPVQRGDRLPHPGAARNRRPPLRHHDPCERRRPGLRLASRSGARMTRRRLTDRLATGWMIVSVLVALVPLAFILGYVVYKGAGIVSWTFLTKPEPLD